MMKCKLKLALLCVCIAFNFASLVSAACSEHFFDCKNGKCIAHFFQCDGDNDCGNFEDEMDCMPDEGHNQSSSLIFTHFEPPCPDDHFACHDIISTCIPKRWVCDGIEECANGADEKECTKDKVDCGDDFKCDDLQCVPMSWRCDGIMDCDDKSDEKNCTQFAKTELCDKEHDKFQCSTGECIPYRKVCDNSTDCLLGDDEGLFCHMAACHEKKCSHLCMFNQQKNASECYCPPGYTLNNDTCHDFDECSDNRLTNMCSQKCTNLEGSYRCDCFNGYEMINSSCVIKGESPVLYFSNGKEIRAFDLRNHTLYPVVETKGKEIIVGMDFAIAKKKLIYIGSEMNSHGSVYQASIDGSQQLKTNVQLLFHENLKGIEGIAVDWLAGHFYMTESADSKIVVCNIDSVHCATLKDNLSNPRGILVVPPRGKLFWTQWGKQQGIFEAGMDGSNATLLTGDVAWPNDLAYDEEMNRLYWCDGKDGIIEYYDFEIKARHTVLKDHMRQPYSLFVFEDNLYFSDWATSTIEMCNKISGHHIKPLIMDPVDRFFGVSVYHPTMQKSHSMRTFNPCEMNLCSHLCLLKAGATSFSCACPDHMSLTADGRTCRSNSQEPFLLVNTGHKVLKYYLNSISNSHSEELQILPIFKIDELAYNFEREELYIHDTFKNRIGLLDLKKKGHLQWKVLADSGIKGVMGLVYDVNSDNIYWVDMFKGTLEVASTRASGRAELNNKLVRPISLALSPQTRKVYVGLRSNPAEIVTLDMDGKNMKTLMVSSNGFPLALTTDGANQLLWGDPVLQKIDFIEVANQRPTNQPHKLISSNVDTINSIAVANGTVYWTNIDASAFYYSALESASAGQRKVHTRRLTDSFVNLDLLKVIVGTKQVPLYDECLPGKHQCDHLCLIGASGRTCQCSEGYVSNDNGLNCDKAAPKALSKVIITGDTFDPESFFQKISDSWMHSDVDTWKLNGYAPAAPAAPILPKNFSIIPATTSPSAIVSGTSNSSKSDNPSQVSTTEVKRRHTGVFSLFFKIIMLLFAAALGISLFFFWKSTTFRQRVIDRVYQIQSKEKTIRFIKNPRYEPEYISDIGVKNPEDPSKAAISMGGNNN